MLMKSFSVTMRHFQQQIDKVFSHLQWCLGCFLSLLIQPPLIALYHVCICLFITTYISTYYLNVFFPSWPSHLARLAFAISEWLCSLFAIISFKLLYSFFCIKNTIKIVVVEKMFPAAESNENRLYCRLVFLSCNLRHSWEQKG